MRKPLIAANWKMYKDPADTEDFFRAFLPLVKSETSKDIVVCPPAVDLTFALQAAESSTIRIGAQNMHYAEEGAFTGEISAPMLTALGVTHVILGHSERRQYFGETDQSVHAKLVTALKFGLIPILCVGEHLHERESGETEQVLSRQIGVALAQINPAHLDPLVIAYEPVWAIGTGKTATPAIAAASHLFIRSEVAHIAGREFADRLRILYGGSVKLDNARDLLNQPEIDGALVGGASLDPESFAKIVHS